MALVIPQWHGTVLHSLLLAGDSEPMAVSYAVELTNTVVVTDLANIVDEIATAFGDNVMDAVSDEYTLVETVLKAQLNANLALPENVATSSHSQVGAKTGDALPQNTAMLVHKRTNTGGRGGRGRFYLPGMVEGEVSPTGAITGAALDSANINLEAFRLAVNFITGVEQMVLLHDSEGAHAADPPHDIVLLQADPVVATQRRRLRR